MSIINEILAEFDSQTIALRNAFADIEAERQTLLTACANLTSDNAALKWELDTLKRTNPWPLPEKPSQ